MTLLGTVLLRSSVPTHYYMSPSGRARRRVLGQNNRNLAQIVTVLGTVLSRGHALVDPADAQRMVTLLQQMQSSLPPQVGDPPSWKGKE